MEKLIGMLKRINRTVLEVDLGIVACAVVLQGIAVLFAQDRLNWCLSFLLGSVLAMLAISHMYRTLDRALDLGEGVATKMIYRGYLTRYLVLVAVILFLTATGFLNPLLVFLAYMSMKVAVYLQPFSHKLFNGIFHETDPEPEPLPDEEQGAGAKEATSHSSR